MIRVALLAVAGACMPRSSAATQNSTLDSANYSRLTGGMQMERGELGLYCHEVRAAYNIYIINSYGRLWVHPRGSERRVGALLHV